MTNKHAPAITGVRLLALTARTLSPEAALIGMTGNATIVFHGVARAANLTPKFEDSGGLLTLQN
jgi:hypothetical protein